MNCIVFWKKITQLTKILHDRRSRRSRQISSLSTTRLTLRENKSKVHCHINKFYEKLFFNRTTRIREGVFGVATNTLATSSASLGVNWVADLKICPGYKAKSRRSIIISSPDAGSLISPNTRSFG